MFITPDRRFSKSFVLLIVMSVVLAGLSAILFLLVPPDARIGNFWISFWMILFSVILSFIYMLFYVIAGRDDFAPVPLLFGLSGTIAFYCVFVLANVLISHLWLNLAKNVYIASHIAGFLLFVGGGGAITILSLSAKEMDVDASLKRSRLFVQTTRITSLADELSLSPFAGMAGELVSRLKELKEAIRYSDPVSPEGLDAEELVVLAVGAIEDKARRFLVAASDEERRALIEETEPLLEKAFNMLRRRNEEVRESK
jgi:hypothetical protein